MSLKRNTIAIFGGIGASLALGISAFTSTRAALSQTADVNTRLGSSIPHACNHPRVEQELREIAQQIRADGQISIAPIAPGLRLAERESAIQALSGAVKLWNDALQSEAVSGKIGARPLQLVVSEDIEDPDVQIEFTRVPYTAGLPVTGSIRWQESTPRSGSRNVAAHTLRLTVGTFTSQGDPHSPVAIANTIAHQIGHTLGLSDLPDTGGVMDADSDAVGLRSISESDLAALKRVLTHPRRASCQKQPDGRWIY